MPTPAVAPTGTTCKDASAASASSEPVGSQQELLSILQQVITGMTLCTCDV